MSDQERQAIGGSDSNYWNWTEHLALMIGGVSTLLIAVRLLSAADFAPETAYAILQSNGTTAVIVGTLIPLIGPAAATLTVLIGRMLIRKQGDAESFKVVQALTVGFFGVLSAYIAPVLFLALFPIAACLSFIAGKSITRRFAYTVNYRIGYIVGKRAGRRHAKTGKEIPGEAAVKSLAAESRLNVARIANRILFAYFGVAIGITMLGAPPWLPGEHISLKNTHAVIGYVLGRQDGDVAVLVASPRKVIHLNAADITRRILCTPHVGSLAATLPSLLGQSTQYPPC